MLRYETPLQKHSLLYIITHVQVRVSNPQLTDLANSHARQRRGSLRLAVSPAYWQAYAGARLVA